MIDIIYTLYAKNIQRVAYFILTHQTLKRRGYFGQYKVKYHLCLEKYSAFIKDIQRYCDEKNIEVHIKDDEPGLASMMNFTNRVGEYPYIMMMQDDWFLLKNYDFASCIDLLERNKEYSMVRLNDDNKTCIKKIDRYFYELDPDCDGYYYSDNPHIKERSYHWHTGPYQHLEGQHGAICENLMNGNAKRIAKEGHHKIVAIDEHIFEHLGVFESVLKEVD